MGHNTPLDYYTDQGPLVSMMAKGCIKTYKSYFYYSTISMFMQL